MYCGNNKTARTSQKNIACALLELLEEKPFSRISVSELCKAAGISRQTFYSLFESKDNVITYIFQENYCYSPEKDAEDFDGTDSLHQLCLGYSSYIIRQADFIRLLVENNIIYLMYDGLLESFSCCDCFLPHIQGDQRSYAASFYAGSMTGIARTYIEQGEVLSQKELEDLTLSLFHNGFLY